MQEVVKYSVVIPAYNIEGFIEKTLVSVAEQTYRNFEAIIVDDGSKDATGKMAEDFSAQYENFHVIHKQNAGLSAARNTGIEAAQGKYVLFLDGDDYISPVLLADVDAAFTQFPEAKTVNFDYISVKDGVIQSNENGAGHGDIYNKTAVHSGAEMVRQVTEEYGVYVTAWSYVTELALFKNSLKFTEGALFEDVDTTPIVYLENSPVVVLKNDVDYYFQAQRSSSIMKTLNPADWRSAVLINDNLAERIQKYPEIEPVVIKYLIQTAADNGVTFFTENAVKFRPEIRAFLKRPHTKIQRNLWFKIVFVMLPVPAWLRKKVKNLI
ncbi:MAG: glycosyltransferase [Lactobacillaceae bacterium]|jgi:glycosyltransferase involved in cell wall biosynthesis|nr:glycosyltransferase [Lactobacillaceae bacterium]